MLTLTRCKEVSLAKAKELIAQLKSNPDNKSYLRLVEYCTTRIYEIQGLLVKETDMNEVQRLQGRATELSELLSGLTRKPVAKQHTGAFN